MKKLALGLAFFFATTLQAGQLENIVQREIRKHDSWVEELVRENYSDGIKGIRFIRCNKNPNIAGQYNSYHQMVIVPDDPSNPEIADAIDHELGHAIYDIMFGGYKNRTKRLMLDLYLKKKAREPEVRGVIKLWASKREKELQSVTNEAFQNFNKDIHYISESVKSAIDKRSELMKSFLLLNEPSDIHYRLRKISKEVVEYRTKLKRLEEGINDYQKSSQEAINEFNGFNSFRMRTLIFTKDLGELYEKIAKDGKDSQSMYRDFIDLASKKQNLIEETFKETPEVKMLTKKYKSVTKPDYYSRPTELFARIVDSLYSMHFKGVKRDFYPLDEGDLRMLGSLKFKQRSIFQKGIEKYRLGLKMVADGHNPEDVKQKLEYATSFSYKGKIYFWPEPKFTLKGGIGYLKEEFQKKWDIID